MTYRPELLSDSQLRALLLNPQIRGELKRIVRNEVHKRSKDHKDILSIEFGQRQTPAHPSLPFGEKLIIIIFPFPIPIHAIIANRHISRGNMKGWKEYWTFITIGIAFWTAIVLLFARLHHF